MLVNMRSKEILGKVEEAAGMCLFECDTPPWLRYHHITDVQHMLGWGRVEGGEFNYLPKKETIVFGIY